LPRSGPLDIQRFVSGLLEQGLSPTTARHAFVVLSVVLKAAQRDGRITRNPAADVRPPRPARQEQRFLNADEVWALAGAVSPRYRALVLTAAYGALRWGELVCLRVARLRLLERKIDVVESLVEVGGRIASGPPKTGTRTISIPQPLVEEIARHLAAYPAGPEGFVFTIPGGGPLRHSNFYHREWKPALRRAGIKPGLRIHDLRHTAVALATAAGAHPKQIQALCGHASIMTTLNVYGHLLEGLQESLADRLGATMIASSVPPVSPPAGAVVAIGARHPL
jgi:integrase